MLRHAGKLIESIAIAAGVDAKDVRDDESNRRLVRDDQHPLARMRADDLLKRSLPSLHDVLSRLASGRSEAEGIVLPGGVLFGIHRCRIFAAQPFPAAVIDLAQIVEGRHRHLVRPREDRCRLLRAPERASVDCRDRIGREPLRQPLDLHPTFIAKWNV